MLMVPAIARAPAAGRARVFPLPGGLLDAAGADEVVLHVHDHDGRLGEVYVDGLCQTQH